MKVISFRAHARLLAVPTRVQGPAGPEVSAGYSADFLTLAGVVGGGGRRDWEGPSYQTCQECRTENPEWRRS